jgi:hypothetical protein
VPKTISDDYLVGTANPGLLIPSCRILCLLEGDCRIGWSVVELAGVSIQEVAARPVSRQMGQVPD